MVTSPSSSRFDCEFKNINDVNLFNDTGISTSTDTKKDTCLVPMDFFQASARGCTPFYTSLEGADAFEAIFEFVNYIYFHVIYISSENVIFSWKIFVMNRIWKSNQIVSSYIHMYYLSFWSEFNNHRKITQKKKMFLWDENDLLFIDLLETLWKVFVIFVFLDYRIRSFSWNGLTHFANLLYIKSEHILKLHCV